MAIPAGDQILTKCEDKLRRCVSESPAFQSWVGAANSTEALARIYIGEVPDVSGAVDEFDAATWESKFPFAIIEDTEGAIEFQHASDGGPYGYHYRTELIVAFEKGRDSSVVADQAHRDFKNMVQKIMAEVIGVSPVAGEKYYVTRMSHSPIGWYEPDVEGGTSAMRCEFTLVNEQ